MKKKNKKKILITGGSGFIASHIADQLSKADHKVYIYDIKKSHFLKKNQIMKLGSIIDKKKIFKVTKNIDAIYHFAAIADLHEANKNFNKTIENNVLGTLNILNACEKNKVKKIIFASSLYAMSEQGGIYSTSKLASEMIIERFAVTKKINFIVLRFGTVYGERANNFNSVKQILDSAVLQNKIYRNTPGNEERRYIHVNDVAKLCCKLINNKHNNKYYNIMGRDKILVKDLLKLVKKEIPGLKLEFSKKDNRKYNYKTNPFTYKIRSGDLFKLKRYTNLQKGISKLIDEIKKTSKI